MYKAIWILICLATLTSLNANAQKVFTKNGEISFVSETPIETFTAVNSKAVGILDLESGAFESAALMRSFIFERALMEEHFNENYMESTKFPKATIKGKINGIEDLTSLQDGDYKLSADGVMSMHGVKKEVMIPLTLTVENGSYKIHGSFSVNPKDYDIKIPSVVAEQIASEIEVSINYDLEQFKK